MDDLIQSCPTHSIIGENLIRAWAKINSPLYNKIICSVSGGSDSDVMLDIVWHCDKDNKVDYVWFDTGLEYQATKDHLKYLEEKYGIEIKPYKAIKPIPATCKQYGQPFLSKHVSEMIKRLQSKGFQFEDKSFEKLQKEYPGCKSALEWWCNKKPSPAHNISRNKWLKEFLVENPPQFKISNRCCDYAKKDVSHKLLSENNYDLNVVGIRKAEGGVRANAYETCFDNNGDGYDNYRPLFWYKNADKERYDEHYNILHSKCYTEYGLKRTGCAGCPYGRDFEQELEIIEKYEPKLFKAVMNIFGDSYKYTREYRDFCKEMNLKEKSQSQKWLK
ncbi:MAG: phosphoadenosine phosphosulfate reductase family protein [Eubacteriales bacterium]|nr:phosphoadenosine phosphosulfate reductase family protein [Eubacteriales bacterium]